MTLKLLQPVEPSSAFLKAGFLGFQGAGKTKTATILAKGLVHHCRKLNLDYANKPAAFLDTETGLDWVIPDFKEADIELVGKRTRAFADLLAITKEAEQECSVLIVDSLTHFWKELTDSYCTKKAASRNLATYRLQFQDWAYLKGEWAKFTDLFVNSRLHIILCGRAGFEYDYFEDDDGAKQLEKTGVKMKAEGEFGFEPSLLVQMELCQRVEGKAVTNVWREAHVLKDRSTLIDGKTFQNPTFANFLPHINRLNLGGAHVGVEARNSQHMISPEKKDWSSTQRKIVLDEIQTLLVEFYPSTGKEDKQAKIALLRTHFNDEEMTWTKIEEVLPLVDLRMGYDSMFKALKGKPSQYAVLFSDKNTTLNIDDEIPEHPAPATATDAQPIKQASLLSKKEQLLAQLADLTTIGEVLHFAMDPVMQSLSEPDRLEVSKAILTRQGEIAKLPQPGSEEKPEGEQPDKKPSNRKRAVASREDERQAPVPAE